MICTIKNTGKPFLSDKMFGLFFEDINYAADGGLYAEMIENRQFAFRKATSGATEKTYDTEWVCDYGWSVCAEDGEAALIIKEGGAVSENNPHYVTFCVKRNTGALVNKAYDGICMEKGKDYVVKLFAKASEEDTQIRLKVSNPLTDAVAAEQDLVVACTEDWKLYQFSVTAKEDVINGTFCLEQGVGSVDYGFVSMMPEDAVAGVFRKDLFTMLADMEPGFLRFPGGCIVEGANLSNRYLWKDTVGDMWDRKWNWSRWAVHDVTMGQGEALYYPFYNQSYGIGFYEYFLLSELIGAKPLPVLNVGLACQFQSDELVALDSEEFQSYLQDALDLIEFANGDVTTVWGALRAKMGHPEPFGLEYVGIGNEQWETEKVDFFARYEAFEKAIHAVYPNIELLGSAGPDVTSERYTMAWDFYKKACNEHPKFTAAVDEHYYMPPAWFYENIHMYDSYKRDIPVFAGEFAAHGEGKRNNMEAALAEAAFMCGLEKNADVIRFASAAPLFAREGYWQWIPDFIWFDGTESMGTPSYYVQKLFSKYTGNHVIDYTLSDVPEHVYSSVSADDKAYYIKLINSAETSVVLEDVVLQDRENGSCQVFQMQADSLKQENKLGEPDKIALREVGNSCKALKLPAYSCTVILLDK